MNDKEAKKYCDENEDKLEKLFLKQYGELPCGGWINPTFLGVHNDTIEFKCHYDNFESEEDSWGYFFDTKSEEFHN